MLDYDGQVSDDKKILETLNGLLASKYLFQVVVQTCCNGRATVFQDTNSELLWRRINECKRILDARIGSESAG